jgi:hypothetical protein
MTVTRSTCIFSVDSFMLGFGLGGRVKNFNQPDRERSDRDAGKCGRTPKEYGHDQASERSVVFPCHFYVFNFPKTPSGE